MNRWWLPLGQLQEETADAAMNTGLAANLPIGLRDVVFELRYGDRFGVDAECSRFEEGGKKVFYVCIRADGTRLAESPPDEERYWPLRASLLEGVRFLALRFDAPPEVVARVDRLIERLPKGPPWVPIPARGEPSPVPPPEAESQLTESPGILWVMFHPQKDWTDRLVEAAFAALREFVHSNALGTWDGDSQGEDSADISFAVADMSAAARALDGFIKESWPRLRFQISDDYEPSGTDSESPRS